MVNRTVPVEVSFAKGLKEFNYQTLGGEAYEQLNTRSKYMPGEAAKCTNWDILPREATLRRAYEPYVVGGLDSAKALWSRVIGVTKDPLGTGYEVPVFAYRNAANSKWEVRINNSAGAKYLDTGDGAGDMAGLLDARVFWGSDETDILCVTGPNRTGGLMTSAYGLDNMYMAIPGAGNFPAADWGKSWRGRQWLVNFTTGKVYYSAPGQTYQFSTSSGGGSFTAEDKLPIRACAIHNDTLYIFTTGNTYAFSFSSDPAQDGQLALIFPGQTALAALSHKGTLFTFTATGPFILTQNGFEGISDAVTGVFSAAAITPVDDTVVFDVKRTQHWETFLFSVYQTYAYNLDSGAFSEYRIAKAVSERFPLEPGLLPWGGLQVNSASGMVTVFNMAKNDDHTAMSRRKSVMLHSRTLSAGLDTIASETADAVGYFTNASAIQGRMVVPVNLDPETYTKCRTLAIAGYAPRGCAALNAVVTPAPWQGANGQSLTFEGPAPYTDAAHLTELAISEDNKPGVWKVPMNFRAKQLWVALDSDPYASHYKRKGTGGKGAINNLISDSMFTSSAKRAACLANGLTFGTPVFAALTQTYDAEEAYAAPYIFTFSSTGGSLQRLVMEDLSAYTVAQQGTNIFAALAMQFSSAVPSNAAVNLKVEIRNTSNVLSTHTILNVTRGTRIPDKWHTYGAYGGVAASQLRVERIFIEVTGLTAGQVSIQAPEAYWDYHWSEELYRTRPVVERIVAYVTPQQSTEDNKYGNVSI